MTKGSTSDFEKWYRAFFTGADFQKEEQVTRLMGPVINVGDLNRINAISLGKWTQLRLFELGKVCLQIVVVPFVWTENTFDRGVTVLKHTQGASSWNSIHLFLRSWLCTSSRVTQVSQSPLLEQSAETEFLERNNTKRLFFLFFPMPHTINTWNTWSRQTHSSEIKVKRVIFMVDRDICVAERGGEKKC